MIRKTLLIGAVLALSIFATAHPAHAQCNLLTLTANGSSSVTVTPESHVTFNGLLDNCGTAATNVTVTFILTNNGTTVITDTDSYTLAAGENRPISVSFEAPSTAGSYVATAKTSTGSTATATVNVS